MCDRNEGVLNDFCDRAPDGAAPLSVEDLVRRNDIDAVLICTPDSIHREPAVACFEAGFHCLVEAARNEPGGCARDLRGGAPFRSCSISASSFATTRASSGCAS